MGDNAAKRMIWTSFLEKYFPDSENIKRKNKFIELVQGDIIMQEYTIQFERLSRFAPYMIDTSEKKVRRFHQGFIPSLRKVTLGHLNWPLEAVMELAASIKDTPPHGEEHMDS